MKTGIYGIFNKKTGKVYIGQSIDLKIRKQTHFGQLGCGSHPNRILQKDVILYGIKCFKFKVLEYCCEKVFNIKEAYHVNRFDDLYNIAKITNNPKKKREKIVEIVKESEIKEVSKREKITHDRLSFTQYNTVQVREMYPFLPKTQIVRLTKIIEAFKFEEMRKDLLCQSLMKQECLEYVAYLIVNTFSDNEFLTIGDLCKSPPSPESLEFILTI